MSDPNANWEEAAWAEVDEGTDEDRLRWAMNYMQARYANHHPEPYVVGGTLDAPPAETDRPAVDRPDRDDL